MARSHLRYCPRCGVTRSFVPQVSVLQTLVDVAQSLTSDHPEPVVWRRRACIACGLSAQEAPRDPQTLPAA